MKSTKQQTKDYFGITIEWVGEEFNEHPYPAKIYRISLNKKGISKILEKSGKDHIIKQLKEVFSDKFIKEILNEL